MVAARGHRGVVVNGAFAQVNAAIAQANVGVTVGVEGVGVAAVAV